MTSSKKNMPNFFEDSPYDPVQTATGPDQATQEEKPAKASVAGVYKKKAGFYLSADILDRFNRKFHELKLAGIAIENKSILLERALVFALDDMDKGTQSQVLKKIGS
jgi:hypothetical protein